MTASQGRLDRAARTAIEQCLALSADESCAIVTDPSRIDIAEALYRAAHAVSGSAVLVRYPEGDTHGSEPPSPVAGSLERSDAFLAPTAKSLSHTRARQRACAAGARGATLPGITESVFVTGLDADYDRIETQCDDLQRQLVGVSTVRVETERGTDVTFDVEGRDWLSDTGIVHDPGSFSNLPAGEVFISPASANGTVIVDGTMRPHGLLETPIELTFADGKLTDITDPDIRETVERAAESVGEAAYNVAELGIGANDGVEELVGSVLLDEKAAGTIHVAIGDDASIGGDTEAPIHLDGIVRDPVVRADGTVVELPGS
ncbi:MAG: aminopeptidase [Halobacteriota archaeon]